MSEESTNAADVRVGEPVVRIEGLRKSFGDNVVLRLSLIHISEPTRH